MKSQLAALKGANATPLNSTEKEKKARKTREELKRSSKHAPQEITSKRAVTRRREIVAPILTAATLPRDPRFDDAVTGVFDERVFKKNYGFLEDYREDEMKTLKQEMTKTKDEGRKEELKKMVVSMVCATVWWCGCGGVWVLIEVVNSNRRNSNRSGKTGRWSW